MSERGSLAHCVDNNCDVNGNSCSRAGHVHQESPAASLLQGSSHRSQEEPKVVRLTCAFTVIPSAVRNPSCGKSNGKERFLAPRLLGITRLAKFSWNLSKGPRGQDFAACALAG